MPFDTIDTGLASGDVITIKKQAGKNIELSDMVLSADALGSLTFTDTVKTFVLDVDPGTNRRCPGYIFDGANDVTITGTDANISLYCHVWKK